MVLTLVQMENRCLANVPTSHGCGPDERRISPEQCGSHFHAPHELDLCIPVGFLLGGFIERSPKTQGDGSTDDCETQIK
jgi:hypothetical protein